MAFSKSKFLIICIALVVIQLGFGAYGVIISKYAKNNKTDPLVFSLLRDAACLPVLFLAAYVAEKRVYMLKIRELPLFATLGVFGTIGTQLLYILGIYYTTADIASMFQPMVAVWTCIMSIILRIDKLPRLTEKTGIIKIISILVASGGAVIMTYGKSLEHLQTNNETSLELGCLMLLGNTLVASIFIILQRKYIFANPQSRWREFPVGVTAWLNFFGFLSMLMSCLYYVNKPEKFSTITNKTVLPLIYAVFVASSLCYMLISWCNMQISSTFVAASWPLQVLFCVVLSYFVLGEVLTVIEIVGGLMIIFAMLSIVWTNYKSEVNSKQGRVQIKDDKEDTKEDREELLS